MYSCRGYNVRFALENTSKANRLSIECSLEQNRVYLSLFDFICFSDVLFRERSFLFSYARHTVQRVRSFLCSDELFKYNHPFIHCASRTDVQPLARSNCRRRKKERNNFRAIVELGWVTKKMAKKHSLSQMYVTSYDNNNCTL